MAKERLTPQDLDARLKFILGITLGSILFLTAVGILYGLLFVTQPIGAQSENDKMFFNVLGSVATFITGTLAGLLIGQSGAKDIMKAQLDNKEMDAKNTQADKKLESELEIAELKAEVEADAVRARLDAKPNDQMPKEQPVDTEWDKD
jgi:signal transduction histidine kinase